MELDYKAIGKRIKIARIKKDFTQEQVGALTSLSITHISNVENGYTKVGLPSIVSIANALSVSVDELLCDNLTHVKPVFEKIIADSISDCSSFEIKMMASAIQSFKSFIRQVLSEMNELQ